MWMRKSVLLTIAGALLGTLSLYGLGVASNIWIASSDGGLPLSSVVVAFVVAVALGVSATAAPTSAIAASLTMLCGVLVLPLIRPGIDASRVPLHPLDVVAMLEHAATSPLTVVGLAITGAAGIAAATRDRRRTRTS